MMAKLDDAVHELYETSVALSTACRQTFFARSPDVSAIVTTDPWHVSYLTGYRSILSDMGPRPHAAIATRDRAILITGASDAAGALEVLNRPEDIFRHGVFFVSQSGPLPGYQDMPEPCASFEDGVRAALSSLNQKPEAIALDLGGDTSLASLITEMTGNSKTVDGGELLVRARAVKLPTELDLLRRSTQITDEALDIAARMIQPGLTEIEIAAEIARHITANGAIPLFIVVTTGERSSRVDVYPRNQKIRAGDVVRMDVGATYMGYASDMARSVAADTPDDTHAARYAALLEGEQRALEIIRPGVLASEVFEMAVGTVRKGALPDYRRNHVGHGIGLQAHEFPYLAPQADVPLESGMVLCVETPYYEIGWGGMMVEDTIIVTDNGYEALSKSSRELLRR